MSLVGTLRRKSLFGNNNNKSTEEIFKNQVEPTTTTRKSATLNAKRLTVNSKKFGFTLGTNTTNKPARKQLDLSIFNEPPLPALSDGGSSILSSSSCSSSVHPTIKTPVRKGSQVSVLDPRQHRPTTPSLLSKNSSTSSPIEPVKPSWLQQLFFFKQPKICSFVVYSVQAAIIFRALHKWMNKVCYI